MNLKLNHIQHIGIPVTDLKVSEAFYRKLGFKNVMNSVFEFNGDKGLVAMMKLNDMIIELYQMPEAELKEVRERKNGYIDHIAFDVDDINETFQELKAAGFTILEEQPVFLSFWEKGCKYFNITGPCGERLEFNQIL
jgi:catechol 2,3-dioxygenase-like lactoylglutathione lyase family enzyme